MLKLYKDWYLDADPHQYIVGKLTERTRDGKPCQELKLATYHPTIAAAVNHVLEAEMREIVLNGSVVSFTEMLDRYSAASEAILKEIRSIPNDLKSAVKKSFDFK